jgi:hypothetical protein
MRFKLAFGTALCALALGGAVSAFAEDAPPSVLMKDVSPSDKLPAWIKIGAQIRGRFEAPSGTSLANGNSDDYYASRLRVNLLLRPTSWLNFFAEGQDARIAGSSVSPAPTTLYNPMDLRQGYVTLKHEGTWGVQAKAGRQEMAFGAERLIGPADWGMSRTFDAVDVTLSHGSSRLDLFGGSAVQIDNTRFDRHKPGEHFYGAYASIGGLVSGMTVEPYVLFKRNVLIKSENGTLGDALVTSPGLRLAGKTPGRIDYAIETILQRGSYSADQVVAFGQTSTLGWTVTKSPLKPRVSAEYSYASGDNAQKDGYRKTFDQFYPSNHGYYGMIDQFGWKNLKNARVGFDCTPTKKLKVRVDFNDFALASTADSLYGSSGSAVVTNRKATSGHIGDEINAVALYQWTKIWKFGAGLGHLYAGSFLKQSNANFGYTYPYVMFVGTF